MGTKRGAEVVYVRIVRVSGRIEGPASKESINLRRVLSALLESYSSFKAEVTCAMD